MIFPYLEVEKKLGYTFRDKTLLVQAFTRTSYQNERGRSNYQSNQVLEFFGDSVLSCALITLLIRDFSKRYEHGIMTELTEGDFSNLKSKLSDKTKLSSASDSLGFAPYLLVGEGDKKLGVSHEPSVLEDLYEAIIGAIWIDSEYNIEVVTRVVENTLDFRAFALGSVKKVQSYKNALQEYCQDKTRRLPTPEYTTLEKFGEEHSPTYRVMCRVGELSEVSEGISLKKAENAAAERLLATLLCAHAAPKSKRTSAHPADTSVSRLQRYCASKKISVTYSDARRKADSQKGVEIFVVKCTVGDVFTTGEGVSKSEAKQSSALRMLEKLGIM